MARVKRIKAAGMAYYHIVSRIANKAFLLKESGKKRTLINILYRAAEFSGVDVATYVLMDNHFHLCVRVPEKRGEVPVNEVIRRVGVLYGRERMEKLERRISACRDRGDSSAIDAEIARFRARMGDLSEFMKTFKQRVSMWFNASHMHEGTLWDGRFRSVLVEDGRYLRNLVAYIHGNPIRAKLVTRAADYEWSAPGAAVRGDTRVLKGLSLLGDIGYGGEFAVREKRFVTGLIIGGKAFAREMAARHARSFGNVIVKARPYIMGLLKTYATHGQRSAPPEAA